MVNIAFFQQNPAWGACEEYFQLLIEGIKQKRPDWEIFLLCPQQELEQWRLTIGVYAKVLASSDSMSGLYKQLKRMKIDLIHVNDPAIRILAAARLSRIPRVVMTYHTPSLNIHYNWKGRILWRFAKSNSKLHVIALSETNNKLLKEKFGFSNEQLCVVPHGLKSGKFSIEGNRDQVREKLAIPQEAFVLICVARLSRQKAHEILLEAFAEVLQQTALPCHLLLVGDGDQRSDLEFCVKEHHLQGLVHFLGHRLDVPHLLHAADLFVLPSDFEGLPFAVLEAMAMCKPIVATSVDGVKDLVTQEIGTLVPKRDPKALTKAILWFIAHPEEREAMALEANRLFEQQYTVDKMIQRTLTLYDSLF